MALSSTATIADVATTLNNPEDYVRGVLQNMHECRKNGVDDVAVTIGVTGDGIVPFYRVDFITDIKIREGHIYSLPSSFPMYNGRSHKQMEDVTREVMNASNWSKRSMRYEDVQQLLGQIRCVKPRR